MPAPSPRRRLTAFAVAMAVLIATPLAVVATDRFVDVPNDNPHHNDITWLADAAVTLGCNPPANTNYCPDQPVRRDQMASFLKRLAENQVVDAATAIEAENADTVDGMHASDLQARAEGLFRDGGNGSNVLPLPDGEYVTLATVDLSAEKGAFALISFSFYAEALGDARLFGWIQTDNATCDTDNRVLGSLSVQEGSSFEMSALGASTVVSTAGDPAVTLCAESAFADSGLRDFQFNALYVSDGSASVGLAGGSTGTDNLER